MDYKTSGVDVEAGRDFVKQIKSTVEGTHQRDVIGGIGGFGGFIKIPEGYKSPILVAGTDGVGTKLELAQKYQHHHGVGIDLVAMCVNDVITSGAKPLFFLDYIATGLLSPASLVEVVSGIADGCKRSNCSLLGGETAEMPGFYGKEKYDLAGFCVAVVEESKLIDGSGIKPGDCIVGIESNGVHSNGFSLVREVLSIQNNPEEIFLNHDEKNLIDDFLRPTFIYADVVDQLLGTGIPINGMSHITGGGLPENLPRCLHKGVLAEVDPNAWEIPSVFKWLEIEGKIPEKDLWNTFNLGIGFCLIVPRDAVDSVIKTCQKLNYKSWQIGHIEQSSGEQSQLLGLPAY